LLTLGTALGREIYEQTNQFAGERYMLCAVYRMGPPSITWIENSTSSHTNVVGRQVDLVNHDD